MMLQARPAAAWTTSQSPPPTELASAKRAERASGSGAMLEGDRGAPGEQ
jgi:hypothetical protein